MCYGVCSKFKYCGSVDGNWHQCLAKSNGTNILAAMEIIHWRWLWIRLVGCLLFREMGLRALFTQLKLLCPLGDLGTAANNHVKWWEQWEMSTTIGGNLENQSETNVFVSCVPFEVKDNGGQLNLLLSFPKHVTRLNQKK